MPRPRCCRRVAELASPRLFRPEGGTASGGEVVLEAEEMEAIRLADHEGLYQEAAAAQMEVSRQTFARIVAAARRKVATALLEGQALRIAPAGPEVIAARWHRCGRCGHGWNAPLDADASCPACHGAPCLCTEHAGGHGCVRCCQAAHLRSGRRCHKEETR